MLGLKHCVYVGVALSVVPLNERVKPVESSSNKPISAAQKQKTILFAILHTDPLDKGSESFISIM